MTKKSILLSSGAGSLTAFIIHMIVQYIYKGTADYQEAAVFSIAIFAVYCLVKLIQRRKS